jgi:hypothetical protein
MFHVKQILAATGVLAFHDTAQKPPRPRALFAFRVSKGVWGHFRPKTGRIQLKKSTYR